MPRSLVRVAAASALALVPHLGQAASLAPRPADAAQVAAGLASRLVINELDYDQGETDDTEFVEIANPGPTALDLEGYVLRVYFYLPLSTSPSFAEYQLTPLAIPPGGTFVICPDRNEAPYCDQHVVPPVFPGELLQESGPGTVSLLLRPSTPASADELVDSVCYLPFASGSGPKGAVGGRPLTETSCLEDREHGDGVGVSRLPSGFDSDDNYADFRFSCVTPGQPNAASSRDCSARREPIAELVVNEVAPLSGGFVEIANVGTTPAHLADYDLLQMSYNWWSLLIDLRHDLPDVVLSPGEYFVLCSDSSRLELCDLELPCQLNVDNGVIALVHNPRSEAASFDRELDILVDSFAYHQFYERRMPAPPRGSSWIEGAIETEAASRADLRGMGYSRQCDGADRNHNAADFRLSPLSPGMPNDRGAAPDQPCGGRGQCFGAPPRVRCECESGWAGPGCAFSCIEDPDCSIEDQRTADGRLLGLTAFGTTLFPLADPAQPASLIAPLEAWILEHRDAFDVGPLATAEDLEISAGPRALADLDVLRVYRLSQTYRGLPVAEPHRDLLLAGSSAGIISFTGTLADSSKEYRGLAAPLPLGDGAARLRQVFESSLPAAYSRPIGLADVRLVAVVTREEMAYSGFAVSAGLRIARALVSADDGRVLALHDFGDEFPGQPASLALRAERPDASDPFSGEVPLADTAVASKLPTGEDVPGIELAGSYSLASPFLFIKDLSRIETDYYEALASRPLVSSPAPLFDATPGSTDFFAADTYYKLLSLHRLVSERISSQWDSALGDDSTYEVGEFEPRVAVTLGAGDCDDRSACASLVHWDEDAGSLPTPGSVFAQRKAEGPWEPLGLITLRSGGVNLQSRNLQVVHEFGHIVDYFLATGSARPTAACGDPSLPCPIETQCVVDSDDEAPPLSESIAQLFAIWAMPALFTSVGPETCEVIAFVSNGGDGLPHNETCRAFLPCGPFAFDSRCRPAVYDPNTVHQPGSEKLPCGDEARAMGLCECEPSPTGTCQSSTWRRAPCEELGCTWRESDESCLCPTGACDKEAGYGVDAAFQAYWELISGEVCAVEPPFTCTGFSGLDGPDDAHDLAGKAFFYALRKRPATYGALFAEMAAYYSCAEEGEFFDEFCDVVGHHGLHTCGPRAVCQACGNGKLEPGEECDDGNTDDTDSCLSTCVAARCGDGFRWEGVEECDGSELGGQTCESRGLGTGALGCDQGCSFDSRDCSPNLPSCVSGRPGDPGCPCLEDDFAAPGDGPGSLLASNQVFGNEGFTPAGCVDAFGDGDEVAICYTEGGRSPTNVCIVCEEGLAGTYGCPCATNADCNRVGKSIFSADIPLACLGSEAQGWSGLGPKPGICLPDVDPNFPDVDSRGQTVDPTTYGEFIRTTWICKQNCSSLTAAAGGDVEYVCEYGEHFPVATCHDGSLCEVGGQRRNPSGSGCVDECDPGATPEVQQEQCHAWGYPFGWRCATWTADPPRCAPPGCIDGGVLQGVCTYFMVNANSGR